MRLNHVLEDQAGDAGSTSGGNAAGDAGAGAAGAGGNGNANAGAGSDQGGSGKAGGDAGGEASLLAQAGKGAASGDGKGGDAANAGNQGGEKLLAGKYKTTEDLEKGYTELVGVLRKDGAAPKDAGEYKYEAPPELKDVKLDPVEETNFKKFCHDQGLTQKQYQAVMTRYLQEIPNLVNGATQYSAEKLKSELMTSWKNEEAFGQNLKAAVQVVKAFGDPDDVKDAMSAKGNTPAWVYRVLAKVGAEMGEDKLLSAEAIVSGEDLNALMKHPAYFDATHAEHERIKRKVAEHFQAQSAHRRLQQN